MSAGGVPVTSRRRDWERILLDLRSAGCSLSEVARKVNRDVSTVRLWMAGSEPKESDARIVLALYAKFCPVKYQRHQAQFDIRVEIENVTAEGETRTLPFI